jgi:hypothetical protein
MAIGVKSEIGLANPRVNFPTQNPHPPRKHSSLPRPRRRPPHLYKRVRLFLCFLSYLSLLLFHLHLALSTCRDTHTAFQDHYSKSAVTRSGCGHNHTGARSPKCKARQRTESLSILSGIVLLPHVALRTHNFGSYHHLNSRTRPYTRVHSRSRTLTLTRNARILSIYKTESWIGVYPPHHSRFLKEPSRL